MSMEARLSHEKLQILRNLLQEWRQRTHYTLRELQEVTGFLQFASQVIPASRTFLRSLYDFGTTFESPFTRAGPRLPLTPHFLFE